jgi:hypothetical protein
MKIIARQEDLKSTLTLLIDNMARHPALLSFEESCELELKLVEQEAIIKALREQVMYWRLLMKEMCDNMDEQLINEFKNKP